MPQGSGRKLFLSTFGLAVALSCGRTSETQNHEPTANGGQAGSPACVDGGRTQTLAGSRNEAASGVVGGDASGGAADSGILLFDGAATRPDVVGDRAGNALVKWEPARGVVHSARWDAEQQAWLYPAPVMLDEAFLVDTQRSGHPLLVGEETDPASEQTTTVVRRFDVLSNEWGPAQATGLSASFVHSRYLSMDGAGNAYAFWFNDDRATIEWTWWPVDSGTWERLQTIEHANGIVGARTAGAWLWQENAGFGVRAFNLDTGSWSDEHELEPLQGGVASNVHHFVVGPSGEALATAFRREATAYVIDAWRYDPTLAAWQSRETAWQAPRDEGQKQNPGPTRPITDFFHHDIVAFPMPHGDEYTLSMSRRDPATARWSSWHEFTGLATVDGVELEADDAGSLYGYAPSAGLFHYSADSEVWLDTPVEANYFSFAVSDASAFAVGWQFGKALVAFHHASGSSEWRTARGLPAGIVSDVGSAMLNCAPIGDDRALLVWITTRSVGNGSTRNASVRAAFLD